MANETRLVMVVVTKQQDDRSLTLVGMNAGPDGTLSMERASLPCFLINEGEFIEQALFRGLADALGIEPIHFQDRPDFVHPGLGARVFPFIISGWKGEIPAQLRVSPVNVNDNPILMWATPEELEGIRNSTAAGSMTELINSVESFMRGLREKG